MCSEYGQSAHFVYTHTKKISSVKSGSVKNKEKCNINYVMPLDNLQPLSFYLFFLLVTCHIDLRCQMDICV